MAVADKEWWNENLHRPSTADDFGSAQPALSPASPELPRGKGPGFAHAAHANNHGRPRNPLDQSTPAKEEHFPTSPTPRQVAHEVPSNAPMRARCARPWATVCTFAPLPAPVPRHPPPPPSGRRSGTGRRGRRSRTFGDDISLSLARLERLVAWRGCGKCGRPRAVKGHQLWCPASSPGPQVLLLFSGRGEQTASPVVYVCRRCPPSA